MQVSTISRERNTTAAINITRREMLYVVTFFLGTCSILTYAKGTYNGQAGAVFLPPRTQESLMWTRLNEEREARRRFVRRRHRLKLPCDSSASSTRCRISPTAPRSLAPCERNFSAARYARSFFARSSSALESLPSTSKKISPR